MLYGAGKGHTGKIMISIISESKNGYNPPLRSAFLFSASRDEDRSLAFIVEEHDIASRPSVGLCVRCSACETSLSWKISFYLSHDHSRRSHALHLHVDSLWINHYAAATVMETQDDWREKLFR